MEFKIKLFNELTNDELYEINKSRFEVFVEEQKITEQEFDDIDKVCYHLFAVDQGRVIAYCRIIPEGITYIQPSIGRVLVLKSYRKKMLAEKMMKIAIEFITEKLKGNSIVISAQEYILPLYEKLGFKKISETYMEVSIPHVKMRRDSN